MVFFLTQNSGPENEGGATGPSTATKHNRKVVNLQDKHMSPALSDLSRKQKLKCNPPRGLKRGKGLLLNQAWFLSLQG